MKGLDEIKVDRKKITDIHKYMYWSKKSEEYIDSMNENRDNKQIFFESWRQALLCEFEKNKYQFISKKEWIMLLMMLRTYNMQQKDNKMFIDKKGLRVKVGGFE